MWVYIRVQNQDEILIVLLGAQKQITNGNFKLHKGIPPFPTYFPNVPMFLYAFRILLWIAYYYRCCTHLLFQVNSCIRRQLIMGKPYLFMCIVYLRFVCYNSTMHKWFLHKSKSHSRKVLIHDAYKYSMNLKEMLKVHTGVNI